MNTFDLNLLSLYRINSQELPLLPGLLAQNPPKKPARGREQDRLVVYITLVGNMGYSSEEYAQITAQAAETFYNTPGSLTYALKTTAEWLNTFLVEKNMKSNGKGLYSIGALVLCTLRGNSLYIVQSGPTHVYHMGAEIRHLYDAQLAGKGLGISQAAHLYFAQTPVNSSDRILLCAALPPNWDKSITEGRGSTALEITRRRLMAITNTNISAVLMQTTNGTGALNIFQATKDVPSLGTAPASTVASQPEVMPILQNQPIETGTDASEPALEAEIEVDETNLFPQPTEVETVDAPIPQTDSEIGGPILERNVPEPGELEALPAETSSGFAIPARPDRTGRSRRNIANRDYSPEPKILIRPETRTSVKQGIRVAAGTLARLIGAVRAQTQSVKTWAKQAFPRLLPGDAEDSHPTLFSRAWPIFIAIAIPILLIVTARVVYYQLGYQAQYKIYYAHAYEASQQIVAGDNPTHERVQLQATLDWLDQADQFQEAITPESQQLRKTAQDALDKLDKVVRLDFQPAFDTTLSKNMQVTRMSASDTDIYLLDNLSGIIKRGTYNNDTQKYSLDNEFICGPGLFDGIQIGNLIDIIALPRSNPIEATLLAIDNSGNLLYCIPGKPPKATYLQMPDRNWNKITAIAYDANNLYVLDAPARAVWVYFGDSGINFPDRPFFFFESQIPVMLEKAIDMAINGDDLYLLNDDGHMTTCTLSRLDVSPTRCNDPQLYTDTRPGYQGGMKLSDGIFSQMEFISAPDPAVALLEPYTQSVFRFSARALELQNQVRSLAGKGDLLPKGAPVTAMAFSPNKLLFIFLDSQVFFAKNVP